MQSPAVPFSAITIRSLRMHVYIGATAEERTLRQPLDIDVVLVPKEHLRAMQDDELDHTFCYGELCARIHIICRSSRVQLLEKLATLIHRDLQYATRNDVWIWLRVLKIKPPVDGLASSSVEFGDVPAEYMARYVSAS